MKAADRYLNLMAARCRAAYIKERTAFEIKKNPKLANKRPPYEYHPAARWDGGTDDDGYEHKAVWPKIAAFVVLHGLDPYCVMRKRFEMARGNNPPWPNQVAKDTYLDIYRGVQELLSEEDVALAFDMDKEYCRVALASTRYNILGKDKTWAWTAMLLDSALDVTPLMRYCLAKQLKIDSVMSLMYSRALQQYIRAPKAYNKVWGTSIPNSLRDAAEDIVNTAKIRMTD